MWSTLYLHGGRLSPTLGRTPRYQNRIELLQGTLDMLILQTLQWGPQHGHGIGLAIRASSLDVLQVDHGSLYPALHRLARQGWIAAEWKLSENKQRAKYYRLTAKGRRRLDDAIASWRRTRTAVDRIIEALSE